MVGRSNVVRIDAGGGRGTGFLIRGGELVTALHVVATIDGGRVEWHRPVELRYVVGGVALDTERLTKYEPVAFDVAEDWVVLRVVGAKGVENWEVEQVGSESVGEDWHTYGFPTEDGIGASGSLTTVDSPRSAIVDHEQASIPAMQLFSEQAAAGKGQPVPGFSGAPVVMGGRVVGLLRHAPHDGEGITTGGVLFACPIERVMARLGREAPKRRPPEVIDFTGERGRHRHFFGRRVILPQLDEWLQVRESGWLVLTGSPGLGKSAIFNHWLGLREQAGLPTAFHFIRRGIQNWADPAVVRANLAAQIERDFPAERDAGAGPAQRLEQLLQRVSPVLEQRQAQLVLLVDGLDEAMTLGTEDNPIPRIFPHELPARVFVFVASRPLYPHLNWFTRRTGAVNTVDLDGCPDNMETVREFWAALRGTLPRPPGDDLVRAAIESSQGNLLHAISLYKLWSTPGSRCSIETIPQGFEGTLSDHWERLGRLPPDQKKIARQGLSLLCAARQALPLSVVDKLLDWDEGDARDKLLPVVSELLHDEHWHEQLAYRPFHEGVRELVERELPETLRKHHGRLADFATWPATESGFRRSYALRHRVVHQIKAGEIEKAAASCRDVGYLTEKACALGVLEVEREIRLAAHAQKAAARKQLGTLAFAVGACSHWAREAPRALPALLHDRLLSYAPAVHRELVWPAHLRQSAPLLRHPLQTGGLARVLVGDQDWVTAMAVLPDGRVISGARDKTLRVWDVESGQTLATLVGHQDEVTAVAVLPDGRVVSGSRDETLRVWDVESGQTLATLVGHQDEVTAVAVLPDGRVVSGSRDGTLRVWDVKSGQTLSTLGGHLDGVLAVAVLPDGRVVSSSGKILHVWDAESGQILAELAVRQEGIMPPADGETLTDWWWRYHESVTAVAVLPDGRLVSRCGGGKLQVWDVERGRALATLKPYDDWGGELAVLPDGRVVFSSFDHTLAVWDIESGYALTKLVGHESSVTAVAVLPDGRVVSSSRDMIFRVWDVENWQALAKFGGHKHPIEAVAVSPDGRVISGSHHETFQVWDVENGQVVATLGADDHLVGMAVLPDGRLVSCSFETLQVRDIESGQTLAMLAGHEAGIYAVAVLPDSRVVFGSDDKTLRVWDVESGQTLVTLTGHVATVTAVAVFPDGRVVSGADDHTLRVWDIESEQALATLGGQLRMLSVRPWRGGIRPLKLATPVLRLGPIRTVSVLPDGRVVFVTTDDTVRIWDPESEQDLTTLAGHQGKSWPWQCCRMVV